MNYLLLCAIRALFVLINIAVIPGVGEAWRFNLEADYASLLVDFNDAYNNVIPNYYCLAFAAR